MKSDFNFDASSGAGSGDDRHGTSAQATSPPGSLATGTEIRLSELRAGVDATVTSVDDSGPIGRRLLELGLLPGTRVRALRRAPLGDPVVYELRGYRLCLRRTETERVRVTSASGGTSRPEPDR